MGCHTWFYTPIEVSYEEAKENVLNNLKDAITEIEETFNDENLKNSLLDNYPEFDKENYLNVTKRKIRMVENGFCKVATMRKYSKGSTITLYHKNQMYEEGWSHDIFRTPYYTNVILDNYTDAVDFINDPLNCCYNIAENYKVLLKYFFGVHKGIIDFG